jgi:hypothetical protein
MRKRHLVFRAFRFRLGALRKEFRLGALRKEFVVLLAALAVAGCESAHWGPYVSPRVVGRVVTADTQQPVAGVEVRRGPPPARPKAGQEPKGAELLMRKEPALTDRDGRFELDSERILALISWGGWSTVRLTFDKPGFERLQTNFTIVNLVTNAPGDEPLINTGDVPLRHVKR